MEKAALRERIKLAIAEAIATMECNMESDHGGECSTRPSYGGWKGPCEEYCGYCSNRVDSEELREVLRLLEDEPDHPAVGGGGRGADLITNDGLGWIGEIKKLAESLCLSVVPGPNGAALSAQTTLKLIAEVDRLKRELAVTHAKASQAYEHVMNQLQARAEKAEQERDEARRKICEDYASMTGNTREHEAVLQGWSYLYEEV